MPRLVMNKLFELLTKYSKAIFFLALVLGTVAAYLARINYHPVMTYLVDICFVLCAIGLMFWPKK